MGVRSFRLPPSSEVASFEAGSLPMVLAWAAEWFGTQAGATLRAASLARETRSTFGSSEPGSRWLRCSGVNGTMWAALCQARMLAGALFGTGGEACLPEESVSTSVGVRALESLVTRLAGAPAEPAGRLQRVAQGPQHLLVPGHAAVGATIEVAHQSLDLIVELPVRASIARPQQRGPLAAASLALGGQSVNVDAWLGEIELDLGSLQTLAVGDVLRLGRKLDEGVELRLGGECLPCRGYLGALDGRVAVELERR